VSSAPRGFGALALCYPGAVSVINGHGVSVESDGLPWASGYQGLVMGYLPRGASLVHGGVMVGTAKWWP
jgi:hypothetical protein